jgi:hypothetical protein
MGKICPFPPSYSHKQFFFYFIRVERVSDSDSDSGLKKEGFGDHKCLSVRINM